MLLLLLGALLGSGVSLTAATHAAALTLPDVLRALDRVAPSIHTVSAQVEVDDYTALVDDTSRSSGTFAFERTSAGPRYALDLTTPKAAAKRLVYRDHIAWVYTPASRQVLKYSLANKQALVDQFLTLGIGGTGRELAASFHAVLDGPQTLDGVPTVKLTLTPIAPAPGSKITHIDLWYNTSTWVAAQQQIWQLGGDYHRVHYLQVKINPRLSGDPFSTRFPGANVVVPGQP